MSTIQPIKPIFSNEYLGKLDSFLEPLAVIESEMMLAALKGDTGRLNELKSEFAVISDNIIEFINKPN